MQDPQGTPDIFDLQSREMRSHEYRFWATRLVGALALLVSLAACGGSQEPTGPVAPVCDPGFAAIDARCVQYAVRSIERLPTPWTEAGRPLTLELVVYRPLGAGRHPALIFHHGSTGNGDNPALFRNTYTSETVAKAFVDQGWTVLFPQRRGRGASDGVYDEGFEPDRSRYSCRATLALAGLERALEDAEVIAQHVRARADVDTTRLIVGGFSRGGILAMAHAARYPSHYRGVVNFVGGWLGEGCADAVTVNRGTFVTAAAPSPPSLWIYGENDPFYSVAHSRANYDAFAAAGGVGTFRVYRRANASASGHFVANEPTLWMGDLLAFLASSLR